MKTRLFLIVLLVGVGIWLGINLAMDKPIFSNPFASGDLGERASSAASRVVEGTREAIDRKFKGN